MVEASMEYSESTIKGCEFYEVTCSKCGSNYHRVKGIIKYAFLFLEYVPCYPVSRKLVFECRDCKNKTDSSAVSAAILKKADDLVFSMVQFIPKFMGILLLIFALGFWAYTNEQENQRSTQYVSSPKVNDFYHIDYRHFTEALRPHEKYKIARVFDITDDIVTVRFGSVFYRYKSNTSQGLSSGQVSSAQYFEKKEYQFSLSELLALRQKNVLYKAERPTKNMLHGVIVIGKNHINIKQPPIETAYFPGAPENKKGIAFLQANYLIDNDTRAFDAFKKSAELNFKYGQLNLAEMYLTGKAVSRDVTQALYWLEQASKQGFSPAIKKYIFVCGKEPTCNLDNFYQQLSQVGVNYSLNI